MAGAASGHSKKACVSVSCISAAEQVGEVHHLAEAGRWPWGRPPCLTW
jgi:hypothetical protein